MLRFFLTSCLLLCYLSGFSQDSVKVEVEKRIKKEDLPIIMANRLESLLANASKIKYYQEQQNAVTFFEVKLKRNQQLLSVKFDSAGQALDVEVITSFNDLNKVTQDSVNAYFKKHTSKFDIKKIQKRYTSNTSDVLEAFLKGDEKLTISYEIEVLLKSEKAKHHGFFELLFDNQGNFLKKRRIQSSPSDYVLY
ncbi:hypothetical protein [Marivirga atlantica]|uniref:Uncharacterized protein n=1 Tax=Marivirga atlantica TaxID=1548457 RepID=A0A937ADD7_9BACT|nr:hypothetical protein [Marivirga atlantica]MBL0766740.1 hypothetical protein [Marivirga atlantica]